MKTKQTGNKVHKDARKDFEPITRSCTAWDLILVTEGVQCGNCGALVSSNNPKD